MDELGDVHRQRLPVVDELPLRDQVGGVGADDVDAQDLPAALLRKHLHVAGAALHHGAGVVAERELAGLEVDARLLQLLLGPAHRADLGGAVVDLRHAAVVDGGDRVALDLVGHHHPLHERGVGQPDRRDDVADGVDDAAVAELHARPAVLVDGDEVAVDGDPGGLHAHVVGDRPAADGDHQQVALDRRALVGGDGDGAVTLLHVLHPLADQGLDPGLAELLGQGLLGVDVLARHDGVERLDDRDLLRPVALPDRRELHPHRGGAQHDRALWDAAE